MAAVLPQALIALLASGRSPLGGWHQWVWEEGHFPASVAFMPEGVCLVWWPGGCEEAWGPEAPLCCKTFPRRRDPGAVVTGPLGSGHLSGLAEDR